MAAQVCKSAFLMICYFSPIIFFSVVSLTVKTPPVSLSVISLFCENVVGEFVNSEHQISRRPVLLCDFELSLWTHALLLPVRRESWFLINRTSEIIDFMLKKDEKDFVLDCDIHLMIRKIR